MKIGDLITATQGRYYARGLTGIVIEERPLEKKGCYQYAPTLTVVWSNGDHQEGINPKHVKVLK